MARIVLITGGSRSGKSRHALARGASLPGGRAFVATCPRVDAELQERIQRHQEDRAAGSWKTVEEERDLAGAVRRLAHVPVVLVDCLTLWVNNLMYEAEQDGWDLAESDMASACGDVVAACRDHPGTVLLVTNEVGFSIIPENPAARRYRDLVGRANQCMADAADEVTLVCCGQPVRLKGWDAQKRVPPESEGPASAGPG